MSSVILSYPLAERRTSSAQKVKDAVKLARDLGLGQKNSHIQTVLETGDELRILLCNNDKCWN